MPKFLLSYESVAVSSVPVIFINEILAADRLVTIDAARVIGYHVKERRPPDVVPLRFRNFTAQI